MSEAFENLFGLTVHPRGERVCVVLVGELDLASAGQVERELAGQLDHGCAAVEIDLRELAFIDSSGIHELLRCKLRAQERDVPMTLAIAPGAVQRALEVSGVIDQFDVDVQASS
jgi:anti-anti-sigma factor